MTENTFNALSRMAAVAAAVALLLAAWFLLTARGAAEDSDAAEDPDRAACLLGVDSATLKLNSVFLSELEGAKVTVRAIEPAVLRGGRNVAVPVRGASGVSCDATEGVIGMRGGLRLVRKGMALELRKWRVSVGDNRVDALIAKDNPVPIAALGLDLSSAERIMIGGNLSLRTNLVLGDGGTAAINQAFGTQLPNRMPVARLALAVREVEEEPEAEAPAEDA